jgi:hypothetical protein
VIGYLSGEVSQALLAAVAVTIGIRVVAAITEVRLLAAGWPWWRSGPVALALPLHDAVVGLAALAVLAGLPGVLLDGPLGRWIGTGPGLARAAVLIGAALSVPAATALLRRRSGYPVPLPAALATRLRRWAPGDPAATCRVRLLATVELSAARASARWLGGRLERTLREADATDEQLLAGLWSPARIRLRETVGVPRTEVALLLMQAQAVMDDGAPAQDRLLTLLHLVYQRSGRRGVRAVLDQAGRSPLRHGRDGAPAWGTAPGALPLPHP